MIQCKGYMGEFVFDQEAGLYHGEFVGTSDVITFQANTVDDIRVAFEDSIDEYLKFCDERGRLPEPPPAPEIPARTGSPEPL